MNDPLPFVTALCPTFRHPKLLANSLALWLLQDYPLERRRLLILDDDPTFDGQSLNGGFLFVRHERLPSITAKYNELLKIASEYFSPSDIYLVWEDDDVYLPGYVRSHVEALEGPPYRAEFSRPVTVLGDFTGSLVKEAEGGRFHSSMAFRRELIERVGRDIRFAGRVAPSFAELTRERSRFEEAQNPLRAELQRLENNVLAPLVAAATGLLEIGTTYLVPALEAINGKNGRCQLTTIYALFSQPLDDLF